MFALGTTFWLAELWSVTIFVATTELADTELYGVKEWDESLISVIVLELLPINNTVSDAVGLLIFVDDG